jgi:hypothetical protein
MDLADWLTEDMDKVWGAVKNLPNEGPMSLWNRYRKDREANRQVAHPPVMPDKEDVQEAEGWWKQLVQYAEQGRKAAERFLMSPETDLAKQFSGEETGDPILTILKRMVGHLGKGVVEVLHLALVRILHLPAMYDFFRHDTLKIGHDAVRGVAMVAKYPTHGRAWGVAFNHFLNLARYPVAAISMGIGAKLSYQQYQLLQSLGFTGIDLTMVVQANAIVCWVLFLCFLTPHWLSNAEHKALRGIAFVLRHLFPQQMYRKRAHVESTMNHDFREWADDYRLLVEDVSRYSVEINYRTTKKDVMNSWAKLVLGFVSAALQREGYHVKHVYTDTPMRVMVTTNNWDDGAWTGMLLFNPEKECFVLSAGFWNKDRRTISVQRQDTNRCSEDAAADLVRKLLNFMHELRKRDPRKINTLKPAPMKRGPKS